MPRYPPEKGRTSDRGESQSAPCDVRRGGVARARGALAARERVHGGARARAHPPRRPCAHARRERRAGGAPAAARPDRGRGAERG
eukprot:7209322-Prymnesium_polylepis.1